jgi:GTP-binding protein EngB required for normal cell division
MHYQLEMIAFCALCSYAKTAGKSARASWLDFTKDYFAKREALVCVLLLVDGSIPPQQIDLDCANWLAEAQVSKVILGVCHCL